MAAVELTPEVFKERLEEARRSYKLNVGYAALTALPPGFVEQAKRHNASILELELSSNKLSDLPAEIGELQQLRVVRLKYNNLTRIPEVLTKLPALKVVELSGNQITTLDDAVLSKLENVRDLDLSNNAIGEVGEGITHMSALQVLQLENNRIDALPDNMGACKSLIKLDLSTNNLHSLPDSMGKLRKIQRLNLGNNMLRRVPPSLGHLKTIKELDLRYNNLDEAYRSKSEEGLSRFLAFLREEEERERLEEIERLKPIGLQAGTWTEYRCKAEAAQVTRLEDGSQRITDNRCLIRSGHTVTQKGSMLFVFGGLVTKDQVKTNDLFWMSTDRMEWHLQHTTGERPCARDDHCAVWDDTINKLVIFGGRSQEKKRLNDVHFLDTETWTWHRAVTEGAVPVPRCSASAVIMEGQLILFGGSAAGTRLNDVFLLDLHSWQWQQLTMTGTAPSPRQGAAIALQGSQLFVQGGRNNFVLEDMFVLDLLRKEWTEALPGAKGPPARHGHLLTVHADHLYLYGGYDELGAYSDSMFRLHVPYGQAFTAASRLEWVEMNAEVVYNRCRSAVCHVGQIGLYQVGSPSLGPAASQEEIERAAVSWDTFKTAKLQELKPKPIDEESLRPRNAKLQRVQHCLTSQQGKMPRSYVSHTRKEAAMLEYIAKWAAAFSQLYPQRRPLFVTPKNECGQPKVVCTSVRPTVLPYPELYTLPGLARCVADYFAYEPLDKPVHMPEYLVSPTSAINWQAGDSFDLSTVLCSLLLGAGFDAYVVAGYAPSAITLNDQAATQCPALEQEASVQPPASPKRKVERLKSTKSQGEPKYSIKSGAKLESKFLQDQKAARQQQQQPAAADTSAEANSTPRTNTGAAAPQLAAAPAPPGAKNKLVHAWVLVMAGRRQVFEPLYIEPSTGRQYAVKQSPYEGVEYMWNNQNFWVCMQMPEPHSDSRASAAALSLDMRNSSKWESLLYEPQPMGLEDDGQELAGTEAAGRMLPEVFSRTNFVTGTRPGGSIAARTPRGGKPGLPGLQQGTVAAAAMGTEHGSSVTSESRRASDAGSKAGDRPGDTQRDRPSDTQRDRQPGTGRDRDADSSEAAPESGLPDMPPSWVTKLVIPRDCLDMRCPKGVKSTLYYRCQHEIFALFGECARWDGMVERITLYEDDARTVPTEIREINRRRRDKLVERRVFPQRETSMESFHQGACGGLRNITVVKGEQRKMDFFPTARLDGLVQRVEKIGEKMTEVFLGRDDHLVYRSIRYGDLPSATPEGDGRRGAPGLVTRQPSSKKKADELTRPIVKMTEKFSRRAELPAHLDVAKRVFYSAQGQIRLDYHYAGDRVSHDSRLFTREGLSQLVQVEPLAPVPPAGALMEDYQCQLESEGACLQAARDSEKEVRELLAAREREERSISLVTPYYDAVREKHGESDEEPEEAVNTQANYLTPFMPPLVGARQLTRAEALEVREKCLKALKDRLVERANIIQARHDEETTSLAKRQATFQRDRDQMTREEEEEYEHACEECLFRIHILDKRLKRHEEQALQKYFELDNKIRHDPRLSALLQAD